MITPEQVAAELSRMFPGTSAWLGRHTGSWWAVTRDGTGRHRLVEAASPAELARRLDALGACRAAPVRPAERPPPARPTAALVRHRRAPRRGRLRGALAALTAL